MNKFCFDKNDVNIIYKSENNNLALNEQNYDVVLIGN